MPITWLAQLEPLHSARGRVRYRYRCRPGTPRERQHLERAVAGLDGVLGVRVNSAARSLAVEFDRARTDADRLGAAILALRPGDGRGADGGAVPGVGEVVASGAALALTHLLQPPLQAPVALGVAVPLLGRAVDDVLERGVTSHVLEALAVAISIGRRDFTAANATSFLLALGEHLEHSIERRSDELLKHLLKPADTEIWVERDGAEIRIAVGEVRTGDTVIAATGAVIPVDGTVLGGEALVNEAVMTGESVPVRRRRGDAVLSGTLVDEGRLRIYAERIGGNSTAARIAAFVERSLLVKSRSQLAASRLADRLVPIVLSLAGASWLLSGDSQRAAAVLQADYSCALKLSTPVAFKAAMYRGGKSGMLIKGASALERLAEVDTFVFDKTGTLTSGRLQVTDSLAFNSSYSADDLINLAASVEEHYFHPLAQAVVEASRRLERPHHFHHREVEFIAAHGVASIIDGKRIVVGSRHFIEDDEGIATGAHADAIRRLQADGKTLLYIGFDGELCGILALRDSLRENAAQTLARLRGFGVEHILMLTGDQPERARAMAAALGIEEYRAGLLPHDKARILEELAAAGRRIAFVGDGVNDAPALSGASVGISMHTGADIARLAADVALLEDDIGRVADARELALATRRLLDSNFRLTAGVNSSILLASALGLLSPLASAVMHNGGTIGILLRALIGPGLPRPPRRRAGVAP